MMKKTLPNLIRLIALFAIALLAIAPKMQAQIDLELSMTQSMATPAIWTNYTVTAQIQNKGPEAAENVRINIPKPEGTVYQGGNEFSTDLGSYSIFGEQDWSFASLPAGGTATLTLNLFAISTNVSTTYGQVVAAMPADIDSRPDNGTPPLVNEDDESTSTGTPIGIYKADLSLTDLRIPPSGIQGKVVDFTLDLTNDGNVVAYGDYKIVVYLSQTPGLSGGITPVGSINTGNTPIGTIDNVLGSFRIPANYPAGEAYLVLHVDPDNIIDESDEGNNILSKSFNISIDGAFADFCGFENNYFELVPPLFGQAFSRQPLQFTGEETMAGFEFKITEEFEQFEYTYTDLILDRNGQVLEYDPNAAEPVNILTLASGATYTTNSDSPNSFRVRIIGADGNIIFSKNYANVTSDPNAAISPGVIERPGGYYFYADWRNISNGQVGFLTMKVDNNGDLVDSLEEILGTDTNFYSAIDVDAEGDLLATRQNQSTRSIFLRKTNGSRLIWETNIMGDLVSNSVEQLSYVAAENAVYGLLYRDPWALVRKISLRDGSTIWDQRLTDVFNPGTSVTRLRNKATHMLITDDGGVVTAYRYSNPSGPDGVEFGQLDRDGNLVWWKERGEAYNIRAVTNTSDGGYLFAGRNDDQFVALKVNTAGDPLPECDGAATSESIDLSLTYTTPNLNPGIWTNFISTITLRNDGDVMATGVEVIAPIPAGLKYQGGDEYSASQGIFDHYGGGVWTVGDIPAGGTAHLYINYFLTTPYAVSIFTQVVQADQQDEDSTPNNGTIGAANEDDEATLVINEWNTDPDTRLSQEEPSQSRPFILRNIYPNPVVHGEVHLMLSSLEENEGSIALLDAMGRTIRIEEIAANQGLNKVTIDTKNLSAGMYYVQILGISAKGNAGRFFVENE